MNSDNSFWGTLLKVSLGLILVLSFLQVKMKFGWDPLKNYIQCDSCGTKSPSILVNSIKMQDSMKINVNDSYQLRPEIVPADANNSRLEWSSNDTTVASVDSLGLVTATSKGGRCVITATTTDGSDKSNSIIINVDKPVILITDTVIKIETINICNSNGEITLKPDAKFKVEVEVLPKNASNKMLKWESDKKSVATVDNDGTIRGKDIGYCTISVTSTDGGNVAPKKINVHVQKPEPPVVKTTSVVLDKSNITMNVGDQKTVRATVFPANASNKTIKWDSSDKSIATVNNGRIVGVGVGNCIITASSTDGSQIKVECSVRVKASSKDTLDLGYATYKGKIQNGKPTEGGIITFKRDCTWYVKGGIRDLWKFSKGDQIKIYNYSVRSSDNAIEIQGKIITPGKEQLNIIISDKP